MVKEMRQTRNYVCGDCGESGHRRRSPKCPLYNAIEDVQEGIHEYIATSEDILGEGFDIAGESSEDESISLDIPELTVLEQNPDLIAYRRGK